MTPPHPQPSRPCYFRYRCPGIHECGIVRMKLLRNRQIGGALHASKSNRRAAWNPLADDVLDAGILAPNALSPIFYICHCHLVLSRHFSILLLALCIQPLIIHTAWAITSHFIVIPPQHCIGIEHSVFALLILFDLVLSDCLYT
jgi:hypothetical protein